MDAIIFCQRWRAFFHCFALPESKQASRKFSIPSPPAPFFLVILSIILLRDLREFTVQLTVDSYLFNKIFAQLQLSQWEINVNWTLSRCWVPGCSKVLGAVPEGNTKSIHLHTGGWWFCHQVAHSLTVLRKGFQTSLIFTCMNCWIIFHLTIHLLQKTVLLAS